MGTRVTFGQQPQLSHEMSTMNFGGTNNGLHHQLPQSSLPPATTSADVLAAATVLQNGSNARSHSMSSEALFGNHGLHSQPILNHHIRPQSMSHYSTLTSGLDRPRDGFMRDNLYTEMMFGSDHTDQNFMRRPKPVPQKVDIRWGSDSGFGSSQGFIPPSGVAKIEEVESKRLQALDEFIGAALGVESSAENTRSSSPVMQRNIPTQPRKSSGIVKEDDTEPPRKRRKSKFDTTEDGGDDKDDPQPKADGRKKRKSVVKITAASPGPSEGGHKRRKSTSAATKSTRENLTEDQKRENHIKSEQKRRTLIREGFEDLGELVPGLRGGGFSKSAILVMTADWLEELIQGNEALRQKIDAAKGR